METDSALTNEPKAEEILKRVGTVLIVVGLLDIAYMVYFFSTGGSSYSSSFNIIAVVAGFFIRKGEPRVAQFAGFFVRFGLLGIATAVLITPLIYPIGLIKTFLLITPVWKLLGWSVFITSALVLLWWLDRNLQSDEVRALLTENRLHVRWPKLVPSIKVFSIFCAVLALAMVALFQYIQQTDTGQMAVAKARDELGSGYSYHLSAISVSSTSRGRSVYATVTAYSDTEIHRSQVSWEDEAASGRFSGDCFWPEPAVQAFRAIISASDP